MAASRFGDLVKGLVDLARGTMLLDAEMHADEDAELLDLTLADPRHRQSVARLR